MGRVFALPQAYAGRLPAQFQGKSLDGLPSSSSVTKSGWNCSKSSVYSSRQLATGTIGLSRVRYASGRTRSTVLHRTLWKPAPHCRRSHFYRDAVCLYPEDAPYGLWGKVSDVPATDVRQDTIETPFAVWARPDLRVDIHGLCGYRQHLFPLIQLLVDRDFDLIT